jgi:molecular chaperone GrpE (heat shock protein)
MARGWESKAVESQIEAAAARTEQSRVNQMQAAEISRQRERESLELSRTRVLQDMEKAANPRYKDMLQQSLLFLDQKLAALDTPPPAATAAKTLKHHA